MWRWGCDNTGSGYLGSVVRERMQIHDRDEDVCCFEPIQHRFVFSQYMLH